MVWWLKKRQLVHLSAGCVCKYGVPDVAFALFCSFFLYIKPLPGDLRILDHALVLDQK